MENQPNTLGSLLENANDYLETNVELIKLRAIDRTSDISSSFVSKMTILVFILHGVFILNMGLAFWIGELLGKIYLGFFIVAGFYTLIALILHLFRDSWLKEPLNSMIIKKLLN